MVNHREHEFFDAGSKAESRLERVYETWSVDARSAPKALSGGLAIGRVSPPDEKGCETPPCDADAAATRNGEVALEAAPRLMV
jgi:hypothetical protein